VPALADRWIVTDDGQSYIFRLRDGTWTDGTPLTGESARAALRQALAPCANRPPSCATIPFQVELDAIEEVRAMAGRVVEIRLSRPYLISSNCSPGPSSAWPGAVPARSDGAQARRRAGRIGPQFPPERRGCPR
jgi:ABC-type transport system substrate-binding protein